MMKSNNYNLWQYEQFKKHLGKKILEIGCGLGNITQYLKKDFPYLLSVDIKKEAVEFTRKRFPQSKNFHVELLDVFSGNLGKYAGVSFDTVVFINVLEHIENDIEALQQCRQLLSKSRGKLLLLVPAHKFLYGTLDQEAGHLRRYSKNDIRRLAKETDFQILDLYYFNFIGALGWYFNYCLLKRKNTNNTETNSQVDMYDKYLVNSGRLLENIIRFPFGLSVIAVMEATE